MRGRRRRGEERGGERRKREEGEGIWKGGRNGLVYSEGVLC